MKHELSSLPFALAPASITVFAPSTECYSSYPDRETNDLFIAKDSVHFSFQSIVSIHSWLYSLFLSTFIHTKLIFLFPQNHSDFFFLLRLFTII